MDTLPMDMRLFAENFRLIGVYEEFVIQAFSAAIDRRHHGIAEEKKNSWIKAMVAVSLNELRNDLLDMNADGTLVGWAAVYDVFRQRFANWIQ